MSILLKYMGQFLRK